MKRVCGKWNSYKCWQKWAQHPLYRLRVGIALGLAGTIHSWNHIHTLAGTQVPQADGSAAPSVFLADAEVQSSALIKDYWMPAWSRPQGFGTCSSLPGVLISQFTQAILRLLRFNINSITTIFSCMFLKTAISFFSASCITTGWHIIYVADLCLPRLRPFGGQLHESWGFTIASHCYACSVQRSGLSFNCQINETTVAFGIDHISIFLLKWMVFISQKSTLSKEEDDMHCSLRKRNSVSPACYSKYLSIATNINLEILPWNL